MTTWVKGVVVSTKHWTENLFSLRIAADINSSIAGQYTWLGVDESGQRISQPYSLLSAPGQQPLEFFFYTYEQGDLSGKLSQLQPDDIVCVGQQPEGTLTLNTVPSTELLCLIATGTGVAPFIAMLQTEEPWQRFKHVALVYAVRESADFCYQELFDELHRRFPDRFSLVPFISREKVSGTVHGRIPDSLRTGELETFLGHSLTPANSHVMLCGNPGMVQDAIALLTERGFTPNTPEQPGQLSYESYW